MVQGQPQGGFPGGSGWGSTPAGGGSSGGGGSTTPDVPVTYTGQGGSYPLTVGIGTRTPVGGGLTEYADAQGRWNPAPPIGATKTETGSYVIVQKPTYSQAQIEQAQRAYATEYQKVVTPNPSDPLGIYKDVAAVVPGGVLLNPESMKGTGYDTAKYREYVIGSIVGQYITPEQRAILEKNPDIPRDYFGGSWVERKEEKPTSISVKAFPTGYETAVFGEGGKLISGESTVFSERTAFMGAGKPNVPENWLFSTTPLKNVFVNLETGQHVSVAPGGKPPTTGTYKLLGGGNVSSTRELLGATPLASGGVTEFIPITGTTGVYTAPPQKQTVVIGSSEWTGILSFAGKAIGRMDIGTRQAEPVLPLWMRPDEQPSQPAPKDFTYDWLRVGTPSATMFSEWMDIKLSGEQNEFVGAVGAYMIKPAFTGALAMFVDFPRQLAVQAPPFSLYYHQTGESAPYEAYTGKQLQTLGLGTLEVTTPLGFFIGTKEARESLIPIGTTVGTQIGYMLTHPLETAGSTLVFGAVMPQIGGILAHRGFTAAGFEAEATAKSELFISKNVPEVEFRLYARQTPETPTMLKPNLDEYMSISSAFKGQDIKYIGMGDQPVMFGFEHLQKVFEGRSVGYTKELSPVDVSEVSQKYAGAMKGIVAGDIGDLGIEWSEKAITIRTGRVIEDIGGGVMSFRAREYDISGPTILFENRLIDFEPEGLVKVIGGTKTEQFSYRITAGKEGFPYPSETGGKMAGWVESAPGEWQEISKLTNIDVVLPTSKEVTFLQTNIGRLKLMSGSPVEYSATISGEGFTDIKIGEAGSVKQALGEGIGVHSHPGEISPYPSGTDITILAKKGEFGVIVGGEGITVVRPTGEAISRLSPTTTADFYSYKFEDIPFLKAPTEKAGGLLYDTLGIRNVEPPIYTTKNVAGYSEFNMFKGIANFFDMDTGVSTNVPMPVGAVNVKITRSLAMPVSISEFIPASRLAAESTYGSRGLGLHTPWSVTQADYVDFVNLGGGTAGAVTTKFATVGDIGIPFVSYEAGTIVAKTSSLTLPSAIAGSAVMAQGRTMGMIDTGVAIGTTMRTVNLIGQPRGISERLFEFTQQPTASMVKVLEVPASTQIFKQSEFQMPVTRETTKVLPLQETRQIPEQIFKEMQMPVTKETTKEVRMQTEKIMQLQETKQVQEQVFVGVAPFGRFDVWQPPPPPPPKSGNVDLDILRVPKSGFRGLKQLRGRGSPLPFADILSVQRTQMRFGGRSTELPINIKTLGKWREAAGSGFGRGFPTLELSRKGRKKKRTRRLI